jgi:SAM-dependent methyltransferase
LINNYISIAELNILDIGPSNGAFLKQLPCNGRKSGLDIVVYPELIDSLTDEFIEGFIDQDTFKWSGDKYDLITAFDIFEHLYNPRRAFKNIKNFLNDNGYLAIETGNINSKWPKKYGPHNWWYVALFEHHIFWSLESIKKIAEDEGFEIVFQIEKRHKFRSGANWWTLANDLLLTFLYNTSPFLFFHLKNVTKPSILQPWSPIVKDHIFLILKYQKI